MTTPEVEQPETKAVEKKVKPMGVMEKKQIEKLITADFDLLIGDLQQYKRELVRARTIEINQEYQDREDAKEHYLVEWRTMAARFREETQAFRDRVEAAGYVLKRGSYGNDMLSTSMPSIEVRGKEAALKQVEQEVQHVISRAQHDLERKKSDALRQLILSGGIPDEARQIVGTMPTAQETLLAAMQTRPEQSVRALLGAAVQQQQAQVVVQQDGDVIEGLVVHETHDYREAQQ